MVIYKITNKINGKCYIGQTTGTLKRRWNNHVALNSGCHYLNAAIQKYGRENFKIEIVAKCDKEEQLDHRERYYINLFNTLSPNGYNLDTGGNKNKHISEQHKEAISRANKGKQYHIINPFQGKRHSKETKLHWSAIRKGIKPPPMSDEGRQRLSQAMKGRKASDKTKKKISQASKIANRINPLVGFKKGHKGLSNREVIDITTGFVWNSVTEAADCFGLNVSTLNCYLRGFRRNKTNLRYVDDVALDGSKKVS